MQDTDGVHIPAHNVFIRLSIRVDPAESGQGTPV